MARLLGLSYPGGPAIQRAAEGGDPQAYDFPRAMLDEGYDFSFSGLKTAVLRAVQPPHAGRREPKGEGIPPAAWPGSTRGCAGELPAAVVDVLVQKRFRAATEHGATEIWMRAA